MHGSELTTDLIRLAYEQGVFPMGEPETGEVHLYEPRIRAMFPIEGMRVSRSLRRAITKGAYEIRFDTAFEAVMISCLRPEENWITEDLIRVYCEIFEQGWAHCSEAWLDGELVGGVYGLAIGGCFCAESMFYRRTGASKVALWALVDWCRELGFTLFDAQVMSPHLASLGAVPMGQSEYLEALGRAKKVRTRWDGCQ